jgi:hypothetical protein
MITFSLVFESLSLQSHNFKMASASSRKRFDFIVDELGFHASEKTSFDDLNQLEDRARDPGQLVAVVW